MPVAGSAEMGRPMYRNCQNIDSTAYVNNAATDMHAHSLNFCLLLLLLLLLGV